jgi:hypothetical protein
MDNSNTIIRFLLDNAEDHEEDEDFREVIANAAPLSQEKDPYEAWWEKYRPILNDITNVGEDAPFNGTMFETYGAELERVKKTEPHYVWTYVTGDNNEDVIVAGFHFVNRMGYFITEVPWETGEENFVFGDGDPDTPAKGAEYFINHEMSWDDTKAWLRLTSQQKLQRVQDFAETYGFEDTINDLVAEIDKIVPT